MLCSMDCYYFYLGLFVYSTCASLGFLNRIAIILTLFGLVAFSIHFVPVLELVPVLRFQLVDLLIFYLLPPEIVTGKHKFDSRS